MEGGGLAGRRECLTGTQTVRRCSQLRPHREEKNTWNSLPSFLSLISAGPSLLFEPREPESWLAQAVSWGTQHRGKGKQVGERSQQKLPIAPTELVGGEQPKSTGIRWCFES